MELNKIIKNKAPTNYQIDPSEVQDEVNDEDVEK